MCLGKMNNSSRCAWAYVRSTGFFFPLGLRCSPSQSHLQTDRQPRRAHLCTHTQDFLRPKDNSLEKKMGLKIQNSGLPPMKVLISKKLHILRPAIEYMQLISNPKKVRLERHVITLWDEVVLWTCWFFLFLWGTNPSRNSCRKLWLKSFDIFLGDRQCV